MHIHKKSDSFSLLFIQKTHTLIEQTKTKLLEAIELTKPKGSFSFIILLELEVREWMF